MSCSCLSSLFDCLPIRSKINHIYFYHWQPNCYLFFSRFWNTQIYMYFCFPCFQMTDSKPQFVQLFYFIFSSFIDSLIHLCKHWFIHSIFIHTNIPLFFYIHPCIQYFTQHIQTSYTQEQMKSPVGHSNGRRLLSPAGRIQFTRSLRGRFASAANARAVSHLYQNKF